MVDDTEATVGTIPSMTKSLLSPSELVAAFGDAKVNTLAFPATSLMVPPFKAKALVLT